MLEEHVDGGANFIRVTRLGILAVRDVQRIHSHRCLFGGALVRKRNRFGVTGNLLQHSKYKCLIVLHGRKPLRKTLRNRRSGGGRRRDGVAIRIQPGHFPGYIENPAVKFLSV